MRFSEHFGLTKADDDDWFDLLLNQDTPLYVDPYLVFDDEDPHWAGSRASFVEYYGRALSLVLRSGGVENSPAWRSAIRLLKCPEPNEFCLGMSVGDPNGSAIGKETATAIARVLNLVKSEGAIELSTVAGFAILVDGIGVDLISDTLCNVLKDRFIDYTQRVARKHGILMTPHKVRNASLDEARGWCNKNVELPHNPLMDTHVVLVPERFLQDIPIPGPDNFFRWADENGQLRDQLNLDISQELSSSDRVACGRALAMQDPELAIQFLREFNRTRKPDPYDVHSDPKGLVNWFEAGVNLARNFASVEGNIETPDALTDVPRFTLKLAQAFKDEIEQRAGWVALWDSSRTKHQHEEVAQAFAGAMWREQCRAANVDISKEVNIGRGPVDFKFSAGFKSRAVLEVKHIGSSNFFTGASKQLPQYMRTEAIDSAVYLAIGYADSDFVEDRIDRVKATCQALAQQKGIVITPVIVDARPSTKTSASKL